MNGPFEGEFWNEYNHMMQNTMDNVQKILNKVGTNMGTAVNDNMDVNRYGSSTSGWFREKQPDIRVNDDRIIITVIHDRLVSNENTQVYLEGNNLMISGALQSKISLPVAVKKYGGKAVSKQGALEIILGRDKYAAKQYISIENE